MMRYTFIGMVEDSLSAREARILRECSTKKASELSDEMMSEFSEVAQKAKATLLANLTTLSIDKLMALINYGETTRWGLLSERLNDFGEMIKGDFKGKEFDEFFALAKARSEYINSKIDDFSDEKESRLNELVKKARGIIISKIEPLEATAIFSSGVENAVGESN